MNAILGWLMSPEWVQVVKTLLHSLWQAGLVALVLGLLLRCIASPSWRYRLALGSLGGVLIAALVSWAVLNQLSHRPETFPQTVLLPDVPLAEQGSPAPDPIGEPIVFRIAATKQTGGDSVKAGWTAWLALVWILGALVMVIRAGVQIAGAERLRRSCKPLADERVTRLLEGAQRAVQLARKVRIAVTDTLTSPVVVGVLVPTLILPLTLLTALTPEQLHFVLLHELAHIRRGDYFANLFQLFMEALLFFNPAVWWISHLLRREREACCDALAIELSGAPVDYAKTLVQVAENVLSPAPAAATAFGDGQRDPSSLSDRVQRLLVPGYRPALRLTWRAMLAALLVGGALLFLSALGARNVVSAVDSNAPETASTPLVNTNSTSSDHRLSYSQTADMVELYLPTQSDTFSGDGIARWNVGGEGGLSKQWFYYRVGFPHAIATSTTNGVEFPLSRYATTTNAFVDSTSLSLDDLKGQPLVLYVDSGRGFSNPPKAGERDMNVVSGGERPIQTLALATRTFAVGPMELARALGMIGPSAGTNVAEMVHALLANAGVDLKPPRSVVFKDSLGLLMVHATEDELAAIEKLLAQAYREAFSVRSEPEKVDDTETTSHVPKPRQKSGLVDNSTNLFTRTFSVDANALLQVLYRRFGNHADPNAKRSSHELSRDVQALFSNLGVDLQPPKALFLNLNGDNGKLLVRGTLKDMEFVESVVQVVNYQPPQINISAKFIEVPKSEMSRLFGLVSTNIPASGTNSPTLILNSPQAQKLLKALDSTPGVQLLTSPEVTTLNGRQAQMQVSEMRTVIHGVKPEALKPPGVSASKSDTNALYQTQTMPFGPVLDVIPDLYADAATIQLKLIPTVTEFLGYDKTSNFLKVYTSGKAGKVEQPLPRFRVRQVVTSVNVWDGQTVVLSGFNDEIISTLPYGGQQVADVSGKSNKQLLVFVTATVIDQAGNRVHSDEELPTGFPPQQPTNIKSGSANSGGGIPTLPGLNQSQGGGRAKSFTNLNSSSGKSLVSSPVLSDWRLEWPSPPIKQEFRYGRDFKINLNVVSAALGVPTPLKGANQTLSFSDPASPEWLDTGLVFTGALRERIRNAGIEVDQLGNGVGVSLDRRREKVTIFATEKDFVAIESLVEVLNTPPQMINMKVKFIEVPAEQMQGLLQAVFANAPDPGTNQFIETLSEARTKAFLNALKTMPGVDVHSCPEVTTLSGRQMQMQDVEVQTFGGGMKYVLTNGSTEVIRYADSLPFKPMVDVLPTILWDGHTVQMTVTPTVNEFVGMDYQRRYDDSPIKPRPPQQLEGRSLASDLPAIGSRSGSSLGVAGVTRPVPRYRVRRMTTSVSVWDGQTVLFGNIPNKEITRVKDKVPVLGGLPEAGKLFLSESSKPREKQLLLLITPTIVDPEGNRVYPGIQVDVHYW